MTFWVEKHKAQKTVLEPSKSTIPLNWFCSWEKREKLKKQQQQGSISCCAYPSNYEKVKWKRVVEKDRKEREREREREREIKSVEDSAISCFVKTESWYVFHLMVWNGEQRETFTSGCGYIFSYLSQLHI